jgi:hypothetical protein
MVDVDRVHVGALLLPIETLDVELTTLVQIDGVVVDQHRRGELVDLADHPAIAARAPSPTSRPRSLRSLARTAGAGGGVDNHHVGGSGAAQ